MKCFLIFGLVLFIFKPFQQELRLKGDYQMQFEEKYATQNCKVTFEDSIYIRKLPNGKSIKGHIVYRKFNVALKDDELPLQMDFSIREIQKDTIFFGTKNLNDKPIGSELIVNSGKLIRVK